MNNIIKIKYQKDQQSLELVLKGERYDNTLPNLLRDIIMLREKMYEESTYEYQYHAFYFEGYLLLTKNISDEECNIIIDFNKNHIEMDYMLETYQSFHECQEYYQPIYEMNHKYYMGNNDSFKEVKELDEDDYKVMMSINNKTVISFKEMLDFSRSMHKCTLANTDTYYFRNVIIHFNFQ